MVFGHTREVWGGDDGAVVIDFDEEGQIAFKTWTDSPDGLRALIRRWLTWL